MFKPTGHLLRLQAKDTFLNFTWDKSILVKSLLPQILREKGSFGCNRSGGSRCVLIEYGSPNIAKPFHVGHLRSAIIGNFLKHVYRANGFEVIGINYLGDWGKQYGLLALGYLKYGDDAEIEKDAIRHLFDVYVKINADAEVDPSIHEKARYYFKCMENGDQEALVLWKKFRDLSIVKYREIYRRLNIEYEVYSGESFYESGMKTAIQVLAERNLLTTSEKAQLVDLRACSLGCPIVLKSDGATLYLTRDLAAAIGRYNEFRFYKSIYVIGSSQDFYMKQVFKVLELMGYLWANNCVHVSYGMVKGMSTRKGTVKFLEDILDEVKRVMHDVMRSNAKKYQQIENPEKVADILAVSAVIIQDFSAKRTKAYDFNMNRMTSFEGDTGPYLQYTYARLCSIGRKLGSMELDLLTLSEIESIDYSLLKEERALHLVTLLAKYPNVVADACRTEEACLVVSYLMTLCHSLSGVIEDLYVLGQEEGLARARMALYLSARIVLGNGMRLLGLVPLERM